MKYQIRYIIIIVHLGKCEESSYFSTFSVCGGGCDLVLVVFVRSGRGTPAGSTQSHQTLTVTLSLPGGLGIPTSDRIFIGFEKLFGRLFVIRNQVMFQVEKVYFLLPQIMQGLFFCDIHEIRIVIFDAIYKYQNRGRIESRS